MALRRYFGTRSARVRVIPPDGRGVEVSNLDGNVGHRIQFTVKKTATPAPDTCEVRIYNLGRADLGRIETLRGEPGDAIDLAAYGGPALPFGADRTPDAPALDKLSRVEVEAGYDGSLSTVFSAIAATVFSDRPDFVTTVTTISGIDGLDGDLFGGINETFEGGARLFDVVDSLRRKLGLERGNLDDATFASLVGNATIDNPFTLSGQSSEQLDRVFEYLVTTDNRALVRWFRTGGAFYVWRPDGFVAGRPTRLRPLLRAPARTRGGNVQVRAYLTPDATPGRLIQIDEVPTSVDLGGVRVARGFPEFEIPPGLYTCLEVEHSLDTDAKAQSAATTTVTLNPERRSL